MVRRARPPRLFPYTTLFRSHEPLVLVEAHHEPELLPSAHVAAGALLEPLEHARAVVGEQPCAERRHLPAPEAEGRHRLGLEVLAHERDVLHTVPPPEKRDPG